MIAAQSGPTSGRPFTRDMVDAVRFWSQVEQGDGCWVWKGTLGRSGYGAMNVPRFRRGPVSAHRIAYVLTHGSIEAGLCVMHSCDNPPCVNPAHLTTGTHRENMDDMARKGRAGARIPLAMRVWKDSAPIAGFLAWKDGRWQNQNSGKTHCKAGHLFDESNTMHRVRDGKPTRWCRQCRLEFDARRRKARRQRLG